MEVEDPPILMKLKYLKSIMLQYRMEHSKELLIQITDILKDLTQKDSLNFEVPESLKYTEPDCVEVYKQTAQDRLARANELVETKQSNFKRVVGVYDRNLKGPSGPPGPPAQKPPAQSKP